MTLYTEMFVSKWHWITAFLIAVAWIALVAGGYDRRVILRSGAGAMVALYVITTIPIATITYQEKSIDSWMRGQVERHYEYKMGQLNGPPGKAERLAVAVGYVKDDDMYKNYIYVGNYNDSYRFYGRLIVRTYDEQGQALDEQTFEGLRIEPGEVKKIDTFYASSPFQTYRYDFMSQGE